MKWNVADHRIDNSLRLIPETADELDVLERSRLYLTSIGCALELWEMVLLTQSGAWDPQHRTAPSPEGPTQTPAAALHAIREKESPFIRDLRFLLERTAATAEIARAEIVIAAIAASRSNRVATLRWIADPARHRPEAERRISSLSWRAGKLIQEVERRRAAAWEASVREQSAMPRRPSAPSSPPFDGRVPALHPRMLADLRRAHHGSRLLRRHLFHRVEPWELVLMITSEGDLIRSRLDSLLVGERTGAWDSLEELALSLVGRGVGIRCEWGSRIQELRSYLQGLCARDRDRVDVGMEILLAAPAGRRRARQWLASPVDHAPAAASYMSAVFAIADRHAADLEPGPTIVVTRAA